MNFCRLLSRVSRVIDLSMSITNDKKDGRYIRMASMLAYTREFMIAVDINSTMPTKSDSWFFLNSHATSGETGSDRSASRTSRYGSFNETKVENGSFE
jgi:hypothetical protein